MITKNAQRVIVGALESVRGLWDELLVADAGSSDGTVEIVKRFGGTVIQSMDSNLGRRKQWLVEKAKGEWILVLDSDERVSKKLSQEIQAVVGSRRPTVVGYEIRYQNYVLGKPVYFGGERYSKVRLFRSGKGKVLRIPLHEEIEVNGKIGKLSGLIHHHSYRTPLQLFSKFTRYAWLSAGELRKKGEPVTLAKLFLYGPHLFWARFVREQGWRDGWRGLVLAKAFGYMEALTYWLLLLSKLLKAPLGRPL